MHLEGSAHSAACTCLGAPAPATKRGERTFGRVRGPWRPGAGNHARGVHSAACAGLRGFRNHTQVGYDLANCRASTPTRIGRGAREIRSRSSLWLANASSAVAPSKFSALPGAGVAGAEVRAARVARAPAPRGWPAMPTPRWRRSTRRDRVMVPLGFAQKAGRAEGIWGRSDSSAMDRPRMRTASALGRDADAHRAAQSVPSPSLPPFRPSCAIPMWSGLPPKQVRRSSPGMRGFLSADAAFPAAKIERTCEPLYGLGRKTAGLFLPRAQVWANAQKWHRVRGF
jgi:hypothetical protein